MIKTGDLVTTTKAGKIWGYIPYSKKIVGNVTSVSTDGYAVLVKCNDSGILFAVRIMDLKLVQLNERTVTMRDIDGKLVQAKVGDMVAAWCCVSKHVRGGRIEAIKKGFRVEGLKHTPKAINCMFIGER